MVSVADFRAPAVQVAAAQKGKPYRRTLPRTSREQLNVTSA